MEVILVEKPQCRRISNADNIEKALKTFLTDETKTPDSSYALRYIIYCNRTLLAPTVGQPVLRGCI